MKNYYVFICLDNVPIMELLLDCHKKAIVNYDKINWNAMMYIILNFQTRHERTNQILKKGKIKYRSEVLTKQFCYYQINIENAHLANKEKKVNVTKCEWSFIELSEILFYSKPYEFINYITKKKLFSPNEIMKFKEAYHTMQEENEILKSWKNVKAKK